jgi:hypothetical protein
LRALRNSPIVRANLYRIRRYWVHEVIIGGGELDDHERRDLIDELKQKLDD